MAIVLVAGGLKGTDNILWIGGAEVDIARIEASAAKIGGRHGLRLFCVISRDWNAGRILGGVGELYGLGDFGLLRILSETRAF